MIHRQKKLRTVQSGEAGRQARIGRPYREWKNKAVGEETSKLASQMSAECAVRLGLAY